MGVAWDTEVVHEMTKLEEEEAGPQDSPRPPATEDWKADGSSQDYAETARETEAQKEDASSQGAEHTYGEEGAGTLAEDSPGYPG